MEGYICSKKHCKSKIDRTGETHSEVKEDEGFEEEGIGRGPDIKTLVLGSGGATPTLSAMPGEQAVYLPPFYYAEQGISKHLLRLTHCPRSQDSLADLAHTDFKAMFEYLLTRDSAKLQLAERQQEGVVTIVSGVDSQPIKNQKTGLS